MASDPRNEKSWQHGCIEALSKASSRVKRKTAATSALLLVVRVPVLVHVRLPGLPHHPASLSIVGLSIVRLGVVGCCIVHLGIVRRDFVSRSSSVLVRSCHSYWL